MKANSITTNVLSMAAVAGLAIWFAAEHEARNRLEPQRELLERQLGRMAGIIAENQQLSNLIARANRPQALQDDVPHELLRLRGEVGVLRKQNAELGRSLDENRQTHAALESSLSNRDAGAEEHAATVDYWPRDSWKFNGYASPDATFQSSLWAANNGDLKALLDSSTGQLRQTMEKDLEGKSETEASVKAMDEVNGVQAVYLLNRDVQSDDTVVLTVKLQQQYDTRTTKLIMKKIGNEWKIAGVAQ